MTDSHQNRLSKYCPVLRAPSGRDCVPVQPQFQTPPPVRSILFYQIRQTFLCTDLSGPRTIIGESSVESSTCGVASREVKPIMVVSVPGRTRLTSVGAGGDRRDDRRSIRRLDRERGTSCFARKCEGGKRIEVEKLGPCPAMMHLPRKYPESWSRYLRQ